MSMIGPNTPAPAGSFMPFWSVANKVNGIRLHEELHWRVSSNLILEQQQRRLRMSSVKLLRCLIFLAALVASIGIADHLHAMQVIGGPPTIERVVPRSNSGPSSFVPPH